jgi:hypothetical protein
VLVALSANASSSAMRRLSVADCSVNALIVCESTVFWKVRQVDKSEQVTKRNKTHKKSYLRKIVKTKIKTEFHSRRKSETSETKSPFIRPPSSSG